MRPFHHSAFSPTLDTDYLFHYATALEHTGEYTEAEDFFDFASTLGEILALPCTTSKRATVNARKPFDQFARDDDGA